MTPTVVHDFQQVTPAARIATVLNSLVPKERQVAEMILARPELAIEATAQEFADLVGVGRTTVIRACQSFGYKGYLQLRVALAKQLAMAAPAAPSYDQGALGSLLADTHELIGMLSQAFSTIEQDVLERVVEKLSDARRVLCIANGLSAPLALDFSMRLTASGRSAEFIPDSIGQQIAARNLGPEDVAIVLSGSGANDLSLRSVRLAKEAKATVVAITSFASSPLVSLADHSLIVSAVSVTFQQELEQTSRIAHLALCTSLAKLIAASGGDTSRAAHSAVLEILAENLSD
ncbi:MAG: MurR/RpiR family transcriptional regulator [Microbacteriaceae bacterium]